ncbi:cell wall-binding repeat-containing protein [Clostridium sp.]|uniref:cell wall-binding repeat-containing protein n=1 Tax=Clostridium sp. TaxID=1506 RepID=UPI003D6D3056
MVKNKVKILSIVLFLLLFISVTAVYATGDRITPYSAMTNHQVTLQTYNSNTPKTVELQLLEFYNGTEANTIVSEENRFNKVPAYDEEWLLMKFNMKYVNGPYELLNASDIIYSGSNFYKKDGEIIAALDTPSFIHNLKGLGQFNVSLYPGEQSVVWYGILVKKNVGYPLVKIKSGYDSTTDSTIYSWFSTDPSNLEPIDNVSYDRNESTGGTVPKDSEEYSNYDQVTILGNTGSLTKTNYAFVGWNTEADGSGTDYVAGDTFEMGSENVIFYAKWIVDDSTIPTIRYQGSNRFETAVEISKAGWVSSDYVVLANAYGFADALTGVPFAYLKDAPILLTDKNSIPQFTYDEIERLGAMNIYILGGTGVISKNIESELKSNEFNVVRLAGSNRFETAIQIGNEVLMDNSSETAVLTTAYNYPDALAMSSYAAMNKYPILYTQTNILNIDTEEFLKNNGITKVIIPGGIGVVSENVAKQLRMSGITVERIDGVDRYNTAVNIAIQYESSFKDEVMIATGNNFPDALAGGVLAAKKQIPILLVNKDRVKDEVKNYIKFNVYGNMYILGGTGVIPDAILR